VVYTGTHDNETISGWFTGLDKAGREQVRDYLMDHSTPIKRMHLKLIGLALMSAADTCIIPIQDWLGLDNSARMNMPGTVEVNWSWRMAPGAIPEDLGPEMLKLTKRFGRANWDALKALEKKNSADSASIS
jgi:4-alpha-glucanotransferase